MTKDIDVLKHFIAGIHRLSLGLSLVTLALAFLLPLPALAGRDATAVTAAAPLEQAMDAVLVVRSADPEDRFLGSAFLWGAEGLVAVTNAHVVGKAEEVHLIDRQGASLIGTVIARDDRRDVAVIALPPRADGSARRGIEAADQPALLGLPVYALGAPLGADFTLTEGLISAMARQVDAAVPLRLLQHDAAVNPGSSGGPLVDATGRLMGMNSRIADGSRMFVGIAYAIATAELAPIVEGLIAETLAPLPRLGLTLRPVDRKLSATLGLSPGGLLVDAVTKGGLAAVAGVQAGDILLTIDGTDLRETGILAFAVEAAQARGAADLTVLRGGSTITLTVSLLFAEADQGLLGQRLRGPEEDRAAPLRVSRYRLSALGLTLGDGGQITALTQNSPALLAGLAVGETIIGINGQRLDHAALLALEITAPVLILIESPGGLTRHLYLDPWASADGTRPLGGANVLDPAVVVF